jgi:serine/threonine protein kinase
MALSIDRVFYVWGEFYKQGFSVPTETMFKSFNEIFAHYFEQNFEVSEEIIEFSDLYFHNGYYERHVNEIEKLGEGGYGEVFKARDKIPPEDLYAIKKIRLVPSKKEILREIQIFHIVQSLYTEHAVSHIKAWIEKINDNNKSKYILFIEMDLCDITLQEIIDKIKSEVKNSEEVKIKRVKKKCEDISTPIGYYIASQLFIEILESVQYLHENNIIHRDLNPYNIMLKIPKNFESFIKIIDFGLIAIHESADQTHSSNKGNIVYIAPEVYDGNKYDTKADIYSLGIILNELFRFDVNE